MVTFLCLISDKEKERELATDPPRKLNFYKSSSESDFHP